MLENKLIRRAFLVAIVAALAAPVSMAGKGGKKGKPGGGGPIANPALTFVGEGVQIATSGGALQTITTDGELPVWTPDGDRVVFLRRENPAKLYVVDADGNTPEEEIFEFPASGPFPNHDNALAISPDGTKIFHEYASSGGDDDLYMADLPSGQIQALGVGVGDWTLLQTQAGVFGPDIDPATPGFQGLVAYSAALRSGQDWDWDLHVVEVVTAADGSLFADVATIRSLPLPDDQNFPKWSPDGTQIAFVDKAGGVQGGNAIAVLDFDVSTGFGAVRVLWEGGLPGPPAWSPDGNWIAFRKAEAWPHGKPNKRLPNFYSRIRPDGTGLTVMMSAGHWLVDWNPAWINDID